VLSSPLLVLLTFVARPTTTDAEGITRIDDASGSTGHSYGPLGQVVREDLTIDGPRGGETPATLYDYNAETRTSCDTRGRVRLPDGRVAIRCSTIHQSVDAFRRAIVGDAEVLVSEAIDKLAGLILNGWAIRA